MAAIYDAFLMVLAAFDVSDAVFPPLACAVAIPGPRAPLAVKNMWEMSTTPAFDADGAKTDVCLSAALEAELAMFEEEELAFLEGPLALDVAPEAPAMCVSPPEEDEATSFEVPVICISLPEVEEEEEEEEEEWNEEIEPFIRPSCVPSARCDLHPFPTHLHASGYAGTVPRFVVWAPEESACEVEVPGEGDEVWMGVPRLEWMGRMAEEDEEVYYPVKDGAEF